MRRRRSSLAFPGALAALLLAGAIGGFTASNTVPVTRLGEDTRVQGSNDHKPSDCSAITLSATVTGSGTVNGGAASELIAGADGADTVIAGDGDDCILGGAGDDVIDGGAGTDVCIGGAGTNSYANCETTL